MWISVQGSPGRFFFPSLHRWKPGCNMGYFKLQYRDWQASWRRKNRAEDKRGFVQIRKHVNQGTICPAPTHLCTSGQTETNLESWVFLGVEYSAASPSPGRSWPRCCHWDSDCVCWQFQGHSSLSSVSNWYEMLDELLLRSSVCLQSCHLSHPPPPPPPQVHLFPNYGKQRHCLVFFPPSK